MRAAVIGALATASAQKVRAHRTVTVVGSGVIIT